MMSMEHTEYTAAKIQTGNNARRAWRTFTFFSFRVFRVFRGHPESLTPGGDIPLCSLCPLWPNPLSSGRGLVAKEFSHKEHKEHKEKGKHPPLLPPLGLRCRVEGRCGMFRASV